MEDNRLKLYEIAVGCIGQDLAPHNEDFGCAQSLNAVFTKAFDKPIQDGLISTYKLFDILKTDARFQKTLIPLKGDIILSPTGYGNKKIKNGHTGIVGENHIMSNNSDTGLWDTYYTLETWKERYETLGGFPVLFFRVIPTEIEIIKKKINIITQLVEAVKKLLTITMEKKFGILSSSADPQKLSATVQGLAIGLIPFAILIAKLFGVSLAETDLSNLVQAVTLGISAIVTTFGIIRKIYYAVKS